MLTPERRGGWRKMMIKGSLHKHSLRTGILGLSLMLIACGEPGSEAGRIGKDEYLIQVGKSVATVADFNQILEISQTAYSPKLYKSVKSFSDLKLRVIIQLKEELIILERARELKISITDAEVNQAVQNIQKDYPKDLFEQAFLEHAVSPRLWKERLKVRLLMEKVVAREVKERITITPEDISKYSKDYYKYSRLNSPDKADAAGIQNFIIKYLHMQKEQEAYQSWISRLQKKYTIKVNKSKWEEISHS